jgi:ATP-binding cassette subfamily B protein
LGGEQVIHAHLTLGAFTEFYLYLNMLVLPMRSLGMMLGLAQRATASGARIFQLLDREPRLTAPELPSPLPAGAGHVRFDGVTLRYDADTDELAAPASQAGPAMRAPWRPAPDGRPRKTALHDIDLDVPAGSTIALVGGTGSGKTSLVALISRLYDVESGSVKLDGVDVRELDPFQLRQAVAVVSDDPFLFSASVADNIAYAHPDAPIEQIEAAARAAQAHQFISDLPNGYDTRVGERGLTLSGGQRQRVAIARALLARPRVLILDDATSSVDASTERQIKDALSEAMRDRTTFVIAHRLSTIELADEIVVMDHGAILAKGRHEALLHSSELYREIVHSSLAAPPPFIDPDAAAKRSSRQPEVSGR